MSTKLVSGIYIPSGIGVKPEEVVIVNDIESIRNFVGGNFDVITTDCGGIKDTLIFGFVNDEGAINGMEYNFLATNLFKRELYGNVLIAWGIDSNGESDGDLYDIPEDVVGVLMSNLEPSTQMAYELARSMAHLCEYAVENSICDESDMLIHTVKLAEDSMNGMGKSSPSRVFFVDMLEKLMELTKGADEETEEWAIYRLSEIMKEKM